MKIKIGTRGSRLAMIQAKLTEDAIQKAFPEAETEIIPIITKGDRIIDKPLTQMGGKGVFISEIENALRKGRIDIAVHSAKDLPVQLADGMKIGAVLAREDARDVLVLLPRTEITEDSSFLVGTGSIRRQNNIKSVYRNAEFADIRGNVDTRLNKLRRGEYDAVVLAAAGLKRLGVNESCGVKIITLDMHEFLPAPCQGIIAVECSEGSEAERIISCINDETAMYCFETEREILRLLGADCTTPVGAVSELKDGKIFVRATRDWIHFAEESADASEIIQLAERVVGRL